MFVPPGKAKARGSERIYESRLIVAMNDMDSIREVIFNLRPFFGQTQGQQVFTTFFIKNMLMIGRQDKLSKIGLLNDGYNGKKTTQPKGNDHQQGMAHSHSCLKQVGGGLLYNYNSVKRRDGHQESACVCLSYPFIFLALNREL